MTKNFPRKLVAAGEGLDNEHRVRILGIIDKIRELGVAENISLPQLVVIGDQSSGKSSLLEGLTGLSFPVASELCTRFATQIVLRRVPIEQAGVKITIIPGPTAQIDNDSKNRLAAFQRELGADEFGSKQLQKIFDEAAQCMGVPGPSSQNLENLDKRFSDDILKIELSGPEHHHLSVVDVPGLFHNPTKYQTEEDRQIIRKLIEDYITDKRTIVLAVMDARNNLANQEVFSMARAADPAGKRTVGIITKCDAVQKGDEQTVLRIAKNEIERLTHGWFAVKNRSTQEIQEGVTIEGRHVLEKTFFATKAPWTELRKDRVGVFALRTFLGGLLYNHISNEFPGVVRDIEALSSATQRELELLGPSRQTNADQRRFLTRVANDYQKDVAQALSGNYDPDLDASSPLKLRMHIRNCNDDFAKDMACDGHAKMFYTVQGTIDAEFQRSNGDELTILRWIRCTYRDSRGAELPGTVNPIVLENMFRQQSSPWKDIAVKYLERVSAAVHEYNVACLARLVVDDDLRESLGRKLAYTETVAKECADRQLLKVLQDERGGILQTVNHYYADTLNSVREERVLARLTAAGFKDNTLFDMAGVMRTVHLSNDDQAVNDIHDILKAYYKVAIKRFNDNVVMQVVERHILGENGPVKTLSPEMIGDLADDELTDIASESFATSSARNELIARAERLKRALEIVKQVTL